MIYDTEALKIKYSSYSNINQKISLEAKKGNLIRVKRGLYTDNINFDKPIIANACYGPSYISYEYALSYYGLIPEYVTLLTSATYGKKNRKTYRLDNAYFEYRSIPKEAFPYGVAFYKNEDGVRYKMATKEKALCDTLYSKYPVRSIKDLKVMLFDDLRIDEDEFYKLDFKSIGDVALLYGSNTLNVLAKLIKEIENGNND